MRKFLIPLLMLTAGGLLAFSGSMDRLRVAGSATPGTQRHLIIYDSTVLIHDTDTINTDTVYSDTVAVGDFKWADISISLDGFTLATDVFDSSVVVVKGIVAHDGRNKRTIFLDTFPTTTPGAAGIDSTTTLSAIVRLDTLAVNQFWFETVILDSIRDMTVAVDTSAYELNYWVGQTGSR